VPGRAKRAALTAAILGVLVPGVASASRVEGIDVSRFQGEIGWSKTAEDGVEFAFVQASRGSGDDCTVRPGRCGPDGRYAANYAEAQEAGVKVGPYHRAFVGGHQRPGVKADARAEAQVFIDRVGALRPGDLRPALDMETPFGDLNAVELRVWARTWLREVHDAFGVKPIIYTNASSWSALGNPRSFAHKGYPLWVANWHVRKPEVPAADWGGESWRVWQHASDGRVAGIDGDVDLDTLRGGWSGVTVRHAAGPVIPN
jgi:lysozyme